MVTVVIIAYNHERFIARAVESVLAQEAPFPFDVIVIDDHSDDRTVEIVQQVTRADPDRLDLRVSPVNRNDHEDFGRALDECTTPYVAMLDGDDYWIAPDKLARQVALLEDHPEFALVCHPVQLVDEDDLPQGVQPETTEARYVRDDLWSSCFVHTGSTVFRRAAYSTLPAWYYDSEFGDWELFLLLTRQGDIAVIDEAMSAYRIHHGGGWSGIEESRKAEQTHAFYDHMARAWGREFRSNRAAMQSRAATLAYRYGLDEGGRIPWRWTIEAVIRAHRPGASPHAPTRRETLALLAWQLRRARRRLSRRRRHGSRTRRPAREGGPGASGVG